MFWGYSGMRVITHTFGVFGSRGPQCSAAKFCSLQQAQNFAAHGRRIALFSRHGCRHALSRSGGKTRYFYCRHTKVNDRAPCYNMTVKENELEAAIYDTASSRPSFSPRESWRFARSALVKSGQLQPPSFINETSTMSISSAVPLHCILQSRPEKRRFNPVYLPLYLHILCL